MKSAWNLLSLFLSIGLLNACAYGMGSRRSCDPAPIPIRPATEICISSESGRAGCYDDRASPPEYTREALKGYVCTNAPDYTAHEEWIKSVLEACK